MWGPQINRILVVHYPTTTCVCLVLHCTAGYKTPARYFHIVFHWEYEYSAGCTLQVTGLVHWNTHTHTHTHSCLNHVRSHSGMRSCFHQRGHMIHPVITWPTNDIINITYIRWSLQVQTQVTNRIPRERSRPATITHRLIEGHATIRGNHLPDLGRLTDGTWQKLCLQPFRLLDWQSPSGIVFQILFMLVIVLLGNSTRIM